MISALIAFLVAICIAALLFWAITKIMVVIPLPEPIRTIVYVLLVVIVSLFILYALVGLLPGAYAPHWLR